MGVHAETHTVVYSSRKEGPYLADGEERLMHHKPIRIEIKDPTHKLDKLSRLNYAKIYTVEHNVKVLFIGRVAENYEQAVVTAFNKTHPPLSNREHEYRPDSPDVITSYAQQEEPIHPNAMPIPPSSTTWNASSSHPYPSSYPTTTMYSGPESQPYGIVYSSNPQIPPSGHQEHFPPDEYHQPRYDDAYDGD